VTGPAGSLAGTPSDTPSGTPSGTPTDTPTGTPTDITAAGPPPAPPGLVRPATDPLPQPVPLPGGIGQLWRAVAYAAPPGYRPLELDLYVPDGVTTPPVILFLHGGGWRVGTRAVFCPTWLDWSPDPFQRLVTAGFAVASIDYRLSAEATFPAQLDDAKAAVGWLRTRAAELGVDASQIVAWGESAGAHLAVLLGLTAGASDRVAGVVDWYGPADLLSLADQALPNAVARADAPDSREALLVGAPLEEAPDLARRASPTSFVHPGAPPFHIAHGVEDRFIPAAQSTQLAGALRSVSVEVSLSLVPGSDHMWRGAPDPEGLFDAALAFARRVTAAPAP
jgi:acetyl esterase/lipase